MIQQREVSQLLKWILTWVGSWFIAFNLNEMLKPYFTTPLSQIGFGIAVLLFVAFFWDINKY